MLNFLDQIWVDVEADETQCYIRFYGKMIMSEMIYLGSYNLIGPKLIDGLTMATGLFVCGSKMQDGSRGTKFNKTFFGIFIWKKKSSLKHWINWKQSWLENSLDDPLQNFGLWSKYVCKMATTADIAFM